MTHERFGLSGLNVVAECWKGDQFIKLCMS
jgi:hypothetical protein